MKRLAKLSTLLAGALVAALTLSACGGADPADTVAPTVEMTDSVTDATATGPVTFTFTFSEEVKGFTAEDVTVTGGDKAATVTAGSTNKVYTLVVTPTANTTGTISVSIDQGKFTDVSNNPNAVVPAVTQAYNTVQVVSTLPVTFDGAGVTYTLTGFGGAEDATVAADPTAESNKVAKVIKSAGAESWAGTTVSTGANQSIATVPLTSTKTTMTLRVYAPAANVPVRLKLENAADATKSVETEATTTAANAWQTLTFNFANQASGTAALNLAYTYNKASVFFNFGKSGASGGGGTYYFDDLTFVSTSGSETPATVASTLPVTFDGAGVTYTLTGFGGAEDATVAADPTAESNKVAKVIKSAGAESWAGTTVSTGANQSIATVPLTSTKTTMTLRVYAPAANVPVRLKLENAADATKSVETEATTTAANAWQTLTFNFANQASGTAALNLAYTYNKASVFFNFGKSGASGGGGTYYFDDLTFVSP